MGQYDQNARHAVERCAPSGPQKHTTKESDRFYNHSNQLTMFLMNVPWLDFTAAASPVFSFPRETLVRVEEQLI